MPLCSFSSCGDRVSLTLFFVTKVGAGTEALEMAAHAVIFTFLKRNGFKSHVFP